MNTAWLNEYYPHIVRTWERSQIGFGTLRPGTFVLTLRWGFSGGAGEIREVISNAPDEHGRELVRLKSPKGEISLLYKEPINDRYKPWYFDVAPVTEQEVREYNKMSGYHRGMFQIKKVGMTL